jgi:hypothetical protein
LLDAATSKTDSVRSGIVETWVGYKSRIHELIGIQSGVFCRSSLSIISRGQFNPVLVSAHDFAIAHRSSIFLLLVSLCVRVSGWVGLFPRG